MPILRASGKLIYFAHVPKCGGTSVERYLRDRFGALAFVDDAWWSRGRGRWGASSPQHVTAEALATLFPDGFFDVAFAIVRHPATRFVSAFVNARNDGRISRMSTLDGVLSRLERQGVGRPGLADNHFLPMTRFVPAGAEVLRLEDGLDRVAGLLDRVTGTRWDGRIAHANASRGPHGPPGMTLRHRVKRAIQPPVPPLDPARLARIRALYHEDYPAFGYPQSPDDMRSATPRASPRRAA